MVGMTRAQLGIDFDGVRDFDLGDAEVRRYEEAARMCLDNIAYQRAKKRVEKRLMDYIALQSRDSEDIFLTRMSINGVSLFDEEVASMAGEKEANVAAEDPHSMME